MFEHIDLSALEQELIELRREFHRYPEIGWSEFRTTARIIEELEKLGLTVEYGPSIHTKENILNAPKPDTMEHFWQRAKTECGRPELIDAMRGGYTGCITEIEGALPGATIGIRVDIDCNDLEEANDPKHRPVADGFCSVHEGYMHACGHDAHAAIGIGVAKLLCACRDQLRGKVVLIFQPSEEGRNGAASMTATGRFTQFDYFWGAHVGIRDLPVGTVVAGVHGILASSKFNVTFRGRSAHAGASPELGKNALAAASTAVLNMLAIPRHHEGASRVNVGTLQAGSGRNVIPSEAKMTVETRGATSVVNQYMETAARRVCQAAADMYDCSCEMEPMGQLESAECSPDLVARTMEILSQVDGVEQVLPDIDFGACEDVATIMREVQSHGGLATEMLFGMPLIAPHHNNCFDVDEQVIMLGAKCFAQLALSIEG